MTVSFPGQSLSEYVLAATLVAMVALGSLYVLSAPLSTLLPQLLDKIFEGESVGGTSSGTSSPGKASAPASGAVMVTLPSGETVFLSNYPHDLSKSIETAGANGTTKKLLANLNTLTQQLLDSGEIDPSQANLLRDLANQGHVIAEYEKVLEEASANSASISEFLDATVLVNGKNRKVRHIYNDIAIYGENHNRLRQGMSLSEIGGGSAGGGGEQMRRFIELYEQAETEGVLADPQTEMIVSDLTSKIALIAATVEATLDRYVDSPSTSKPADINSLAASDLSHGHSAGICDTGGGKDSGIHCP